MIFETWYIVSCRPHHSWNRKKNLVSTLPRSPENAIPKARKVFYNKLVYHIAHFGNLYVNLVNSVSFLHKFQQLIRNSNTNKKENNRILVKTRKITCLLTVNTYLHLLPWADCAIVKLSQKKKEFQYQDVFYIKTQLFRP